MVPPNYGGAQAPTVCGIVRKRAAESSAGSFFLKGIADTEDSAAQFQADRIHPNEQAQAKMLANAT
jgi:acyl-CoA thioesterase-1